MMPPQFKPLLQSTGLGGIYAFLACISLASGGLVPQFSYTLALGWACVGAFLMGCIALGLRALKQDLFPPAFYWVLWANALILIFLLWGEPTLVSAPAVEHVH